MNRSVEIEWRNLSAPQCVMHLKVPSPRCLWRLFWIDDRNVKSNSLLRSHLSYSLLAGKIVSYCTGVRAAGVLPSPPSRLNVNRSIPWLKPIQNVHSCMPKTIHANIRIETNMRGQATISDVIPISPADLGKEHAHAIQDGIHSKYSDRVLHEVGLCLCLWDLLSVSEGLINPGDSRVHVDGEGDPERRCWLLTNAGQSPFEWSSSVRSRARYSRLPSTKSTSMASSVRFVSHRHDSPHSAADCLASTDRMW
jgi:SHS2 domain found in N terminus of Rpb7p/Rpc25p/MJ0397